MDRSERFVHRRTHAHIQVSHEKVSRMTVVYDHVRLAPKSELARELMLDSFEDILSKNNETCLTVQSRDYNGTCQTDKLLGTDNENDLTEQLPDIGRLAQPDSSVISSIFLTHNVDDPHMDCGLSRAHGPIAQ